MEFEISGHQIVMNDLLYRGKIKNVGGNQRKSIAIAQGQSDSCNCNQNFFSFSSKTA